MEIYWFCQVLRVKSMRPEKESFPHSSPLVSLLLLMFLWKPFSNHSEGMCWIKGLRLWRGRGINRWAECGNLQIWIWLEELDSLGAVRFVQWVRWSLDVCSSPVYGKWFLKVYHILHNWVKTTKQVLSWATLGCQALLSLTLLILVKLHWGFCPCWYYKYYKAHSRDFTC